MTRVPSVQVRGFCERYYSDHAWQLEPGLGLYGLQYERCAVCHARREYRPDLTVRARA